MGSRYLSLAKKLMVGPEEWKANAPARASARLAACTRKPRWIRTDGPFAIRIPPPMWELSRPLKSSASGSTLKPGAEVGSGHD